MTAERRARPSRRSTADDAGTTRSSTAQPVDEPRVPGTAARRPPSEAAPPPPFEDLPERPLFAATERRVPAAARAAMAAQAARAAAPAAQRRAATRTGDRYRRRPRRTGGGGPTARASTGDTGPGFWPFTDEAEDEQRRPHRQGGPRLAADGDRGRRTPRAGGRHGDRVQPRPPGRRDTPSGSDENPSSAASAAGRAGRSWPAYATSTRWPTRRRRTPTSAPNAIDGDPATSWTTSTYRGNPALGGLKPGVGLMLDLGKDQEADVGDGPVQGRTHLLRGVRRPGRRHRVTRSSLDQLDKVGGAARTRPSGPPCELDPSPTTRYLLVWLTKLPAGLRRLPGRDHRHHGQVVTLGGATGESELGGQRRRRPARGAPRRRPRRVRRAVRAATGTGCGRWPCAPPATPRTPPTPSRTP